MLTLKSPKNQLIIKVQRGLSFNLPHLAVFRHPRTFPINTLAEGHSHRVLICHTWLFSATPRTFPINTLAEGHSHRVLICHTWLFFATLVPFQLITFGKRTYQEFCQDLQDANNYTSFKVRFKNANSKNTLFCFIKVANMKNILFSH